MFEAYLSRQYTRLVYAIMTMGVLALSVVSYALQTDLLASSLMSLTFSSVAPLLLSSFFQKLESNKIKAAPSARTEKTISEECLPKSIDFASYVSPNVFHMRSSSRGKQIIVVGIRLVLENSCNLKYSEFLARFVDSGFFLGGSGSYQKSISSSELLYLADAYEPGSLLEYELGNKPLRGLSIFCVKEISVEKEKTDIYSSFNNVVTHSLTRLDGIEGVHYYDLLNNEMPKNWLYKARIELQSYRNVGIDSEGDLVKYNTVSEEVRARELRKLFGIDEAEDIAPKSGKRNGNDIA